MKHTRRERLQGAHNDLRIEIRAQLALLYPCGKEAPELPLDKAARQLLIKRVERRARAREILEERCLELPVTATDSHEMIPQAVAEIAILAAARGLDLALDLAERLLESLPREPLF